MLASFIEQFLHGDKILEHNFRLVILSPKEPDAWYVVGGREGGREIVAELCSCFLGGVRMKIAYLFAYGGRKKS